MHCRAIHCGGRVNMNTLSLKKKAKYGGFSAIVLALTTTPVLAQTSSPFEPPEEKLGTYVVNSGSGLDTGCTFRSGGPLRIMLEVPVVVSDTQIGPDGRLIDPDGLVDRGVIDRTALVSIPVFDIDSNATVSNGDAPEVDVVSFNDVEKDTLTGSNNIWTNDTFEVDISEIKFGQPNEVRIDIDTENSGELWCMSADWVAIEFGVSSPYVLAHGINTTGEATWTQDILDGLDDYGIKHTFFTVDAAGTTAANAADLETRIAGFLEPISAETVHVIAHSKGGLDTQSLQARDPEFEILSLSTLSTPHLGSVAADVSEIVLQRADELVNNGNDVNGLLANYFVVTSLAYRFASGSVPQAPGVLDLTTGAAATALAAGTRGNISPTYSIGGDADLNGNNALESAERPFVRADIPWNVLRNFSSVNTVSVVTQPTTFLGVQTGTERVLTYMPVINTVPIRNDVVVTVDSARPSYASDQGIVLANHSTIVNYANVEPFVDLTVRTRN